MKVSLQWLSEFIDLPTRDPEELRTAFASLGHEVEGIERLTPDWSGVVIGRVDEIRPHPNADKVRFCRVSTGGEPVDVVCGAWNFEEGAIVAYAEPGAVLAGGFEIGSREIRGVLSHGMICSEKELGLGDEHGGILVLDDGSPLGEAFADHVALPDVVFDLTITPNRPDAMSMVGMARELSAHFGVPFKTPEPVLVTTPGTPDVAVEILDTSGCGRFTARQIDGVTMGPSPLWMRLRLRSAGVRPISNVVDVTNYVMLELGHPLHAFDASKIRGNRLVVRRAVAGETLTTLDGIERALIEDDLVICDDGGPTSLAGTMGGADSEVEDGSTSIFLEAASWDPPTIMWMSRRHQLRSEASARFERGVDPNLPLLASARAAELILSTAGGSLRQEVVDEHPVVVEPWVVEVSAAEVARTLGPGFSADEIAGYLRAVGMTVEGVEPMTVTVPTYRPDLIRAIDLVEEVARLRGLDWFEETLPTGPAGGLTAMQRRARMVREVLTGAGLSQAVNLSFLGLDDLDAFAYPPDHEARMVVKVKNPLRQEESSLRTSLLPGLLRSLRYNVSYGHDSPALFETGKVFFDRPSPEDPRVPDQPDRLGFAIAGSLGVSGIGEQARSTDVYTATAVARAVFDRMGLEATFRPASVAGFHPGRCAEVVVNGSTIGVVGEIHPKTAAAYELPGRVAAGEIDLNSIVQPVAARQAATPSTFPPTEFDLAFLAGRDLAAADLVLATVGAAGGLAESATVFDEFVDDSLGENMKSVAIRFVLRAPDRTLTNEEVAPLRRAMSAAAAKLGAELRGQI